MDAEKKLQDTNCLPVKTKEDTKTTSFLPIQNKPVGREGSLLVHTGRGDEVHVPRGPH